MAAGRVDKISKAGTVPADWQERVVVEVEFETRGEIGGARNRSSSLLTAEISNCAGSCRTLTIIAPGPLSQNEPIGSSWPVHAVLGGEGH